MSEAESAKFVKAIRNQILVIVVTGMLSGFGIFYMFIFTVNKRIDDTQSQVQKNESLLMNHLFTDNRNQR